jgi:hypothetical protein
MAKLLWKLTVPTVDETRADSVAVGLMGVVLAILAQTTALSSEQFSDIVTKRLERGFHSRIFSVRPARELFSFAGPEGLNRRALSSLSVERRRPYHSKEAPQLQWRDGPAPAYSLSAAKKFLRNRYKRSSASICLSLPRILKERRCLTLIANLRAEGLLDWQVLGIVANLVADFQIKKQFGESLPPLEFSQALQRRLFRKEGRSDPPFDVEVMTHDSIAIHKSLFLWLLLSGRGGCIFTVKRRISLR